MLSATHLLASSEAIEVGRRFGLRDDVMLEVINASSGKSWSTEFKWPTYIVTETYNSGFGLRLLAKDVRIAADLGRQLGLPCRLGEASLALWEQAAAEMPSDADHTEIARFAAHPDAT
jgi:3-hydroxyisobutyrate dehydrogenase